MRWREKVASKMTPKREREKWCESDSGAKVENGESRKEGRTVRERKRASAIEGREEAGGLGKIETSEELRQVC